jgi:hypothetical protein
MKPRAELQTKVNTYSGISLYEKTANAHTSGYWGYTNSSFPKFDGSNYTEYEIYSTTYYDSYDLTGNGSSDFGNYGFIEKSGIISLNDRTNNVKGFVVATKNRVLDHYDGTNTSSSLVSVNYYDKQRQGDTKTSLTTI